MGIGLAKVMKSKTASILLMAGEQISASFAGMQIVRGRLVLPLWAILQPKAAPVLKCPWWSMKAEKIQWCFSLLKAEWFTPTKLRYGSKMMGPRTQLDQAYDFLVSLFPCFSIAMHFCSHLIPCRLIVKWLQNRTSRWSWWYFALVLLSSCSCRWTQSTKSWIRAPLPF